MYEMAAERLIVLVSAILLDLLFGEPPRALHPTVWMGRLIDFLRGRLGGRGLLGRLYGVLISLSTIAVFTASAWIVLRLLSAQPLLYFIASSAILKTTFAIRDMEEHARAVEYALEGGDMARARRMVARICSRDTGVLDRAHVASAAVESVAENTVDGIVSPIFYFLFLGVPGAVAYRAINTLDSMLGYRTPELMDLGWAPAKLDTAANYLPARLTAALIVLAAWVSGGCAGEAWRALRRDHGKTESVNSGWPMSAMAGALRVRLEKLGHYVLGEGYPDPTPHHIQESLKLMRLSVALTTIFSASILLALYLL